MPVRGARRLRYETALWEQAYCAFAPGHRRVARALQGEIAPGLVVCGDFVVGASIEACFRAAERATSSLIPALSGAR